MKLLIVGNGHLVLKENTLFLEKHFVNFLNDLDTLNHSITWLEPIHLERNSDIEDIHDQPLSASIHIFNKKIVKRSAIKKIFFYTESFFSLLFKLKHYDYVYVFWPGNLSLISVLALFLTGARYGIYVRSVFNENSFFTRVFFKRAKFILATGSNFKDRLCVINGNSHVVSAMININISDIYARHINASEIVHILFVGRVCTGKGIWPMLEACKTLREKHVKFNLHIVGGGAEMEEVLSFLDQNSLRDCVIIHGLISDKVELATLYRSADIFLLPTLFEGFPRVLYEAMAYSLPIITTFVGSIPSIMQNNKNCVEIPVNDSNAIVNAVRKLVADIEFRRSISGNAFDTMKNYFATQGLYSHAEQIDILIRGRPL